MPTTTRRGFEPILNGAEFALQAPHRRLEAGQKCG
jgi:hypothetical protein